MGTAQATRVQAPASPAPPAPGLDLRTAVNVGLVTGIVVVFLALVGMVEKFESRRLVHDVFTLGKLILTLPLFLSGYLAARPRIRGGERVAMTAGLAVPTGMVVGAVAGAVIIAAAAVLELFSGSARTIFIRATPRLVDTMTFELGLGLGAVAMIVGGALIAALGAGLRASPDTPRRALLVALWVTGLFALLQRIIPTAIFELGLATDWLYSRRFSGLTRIGAVVLFGVALVVAWLWVTRRRQIQERVGNLPAEARRGGKVLGFVALLWLLFILPQLIGSVFTNILGQVGIFVLMGLGLNIVIGYAGLLDLGYVAFFAVGSYFLAMLTGANLVTSLGATASPAFSLDLNFYVALPLVVLIAAIIGLMIGAPVLRLRGDYLAIVTLGFGEIARVLVESRALQSFLGGAQGLRDVTDAAVFGFGFRNPQNFYYLVLVVVLLAAYVSWRLANSRVGRAWTAMREDEQVAEAMGVSTIKYKLLAFAMGGAIGCLSGALFAVQISTVQPGSYQVLISITALAVIILGGIGSIPGVIVGGLVLIGLPGLLSEFEEFRLLVYGAVIIVIMILRPQGLIPNVRRSRELTEEESSQDAWFDRAREAGAEPAVTVGGEDPE